MIHIDGKNAVAPRTFVSDPIAYFTRIVNLCGNNHGVGRFVALTTQIIWEHLFSAIEHRHPINAALMSHTKSLIVYGVPVLWHQDATPGELKIMKVDDDGGSFVGVIENALT